MKKNLNAFCSIGLCLLLTTAGLTAGAQKRKITAAEEKEWKAATVTDNPLAKLSAAEKEEGKQKAQAAAALVYKAILHRTDPAKYPIDDKEDSPETVAMKAVNALSEPIFNKIKTRAFNIDKDAVKRASILGKYKDIDFRKKAIFPEVKKIGNLNYRKIAEENDGDASFAEPLQETITTGVGGGGIDATPARYNRMDLVLRALHCVDETNPESPGDDDMVIGGVIIGCSGNVRAARSAVTCHFDDDDYCNMGAYLFGTYNLNSCSGYPKTFYAILELIEVDTDEREAADALNEVMKIVAATVGTIAGPVWGAVAAAIAQAMEIFTNWLIDDDPFHPFGVTTTLNSENAFGSDGRSNNWHTGNISDHGGTYRAGFYYQLRNQ